MRLGPWLVIRGLIFGNLIVILLSSVLSANASTPPATETVEALPVVGQNPIKSPKIAVRQNLIKSAEAAGECAVSAEFPESILQWCEIITRNASASGLPADLLAALIWQESGGDPQAYSHSGAVGLMQVMPSDGLAASFNCANGPCFSSRPPSDQLRDPEFNVQYGTSLLATLVERHGNLREALKAYGPTDWGYYYADKVLALYQQYGQ